MSDKILVTGGAGYIGSHVSKALSQSGYIPVAFDNLSTGFKGLVKWGPLEVGDILDYDALKKVFMDHKPKAVIHMAGLIAAGESVEFPYKYYLNNASGTLNLLKVMSEAACHNIIFSSSAAVYGAPKELPIKESAEKNPINPYGSTKLVAELMIKDFEIPNSIKSFILRYFNAAGADMAGESGCLHEKPNNLLPILMQVQAGIAKKFELFGTDYKTPDGSAIRDYIHVGDLATAHILALKYLFKENRSNLANIGTGKGYSVKQVVAAVEKITGKKVPIEFKPRRAGDPPELVAEALKANTLLNWQPEYTNIDDIVKSAWDWQQKGYKEFKK